MRRERIGGNRSAWFILGSVTWFLMTSSISSAAERVQFNRDIRPILSDKCFFCHGPDSQKREANLRLDQRDAAVQMGAITVGQPERSELIRRVTSSEADEQMPPPGSKLGKLTSAEVETLRRWIAEGAEYEGHWSFVPLAAPDPRGTLTETIDRIVRSRLASRQLQPQEEADRSTLIRRVSFDLTGLPPTQAEVEPFLQDARPDAYERLVDRLLQSEHYGERMAVDWLDVSRYADSFGFQVDREREMWPWRDWVIQAYNQNLPFDQFLTWQLAGDLLPDPTDEQILATAFNRLHQQESEGGSVEEEYRVEYVSDRVHTVATAFLGLTFECARCHDHKYDPITQREYYQLFAMFQNIDEAGLYSFFTPSPPTPTLALTDAATKTRLADLQRQSIALEEDSARLRQSQKPSFVEWIAKQRQPAPDLQPAAKSQADSATKSSLEASNSKTSVSPESDSRLKLTTLPGELARFPFDALDQNSLANTIQADQPAKLVGENRLVPGKQGMAIEFTGDDPVGTSLGNFGRHEPFSISLWLKTPDVKERAVVLHRSRAWTDAASRGYELLIEEGRLKWSLIHFWPGNAISIAATESLPLDQWVHVVVTYDGSSRASGLQLFMDGKLAATRTVKDKLTKEITGGGGDHIALGERFRDRGFRGGCIDDLRVFGRTLTGLEVEAAFRNQPANQLVQEELARSHRPDESPDAELDPATGLSPGQLAWLEPFYLATVDQPWSEHLAAVKTARAAFYAALDRTREIMVMQELPQPKKAYVLFRGEYTQRREEVEPNTPAALSVLPPDAPRNRLGLAQWLTHPQHPLTARVTVNRIWQSLFGQGLVKTAEDFGSQGARPLYPELLDALAWHFIDSGWDQKQLIKSIVMSQTYRQRSVAAAQTMLDDPENEWLARGPRFRLPAEMIRDNVLVASGLLQPQIGGPPVNPYELSEAFKPAQPSSGTGVHRRSLYTNWRRTGPPPAMVAFDAPRRAVCVAKRERTESPLQALVLLNGVQYVEAARVLGETLHTEANGQLDKMIEHAFLSCLSRYPQPREAEIMTRLYREQLDHFTQHPDAADQLRKVGQTPFNPAIPAPQAAAATILAQALLNHDACVVKP
jgi:hypothetical protein